MAWKKLKQKNILTGWGNLKCLEKVSPEFQWTDDKIQLPLEATQDLNVEED